MKQRMLALTALFLAATVAFWIWLRADRKDGEPVYYLRYADNQPLDYPTTQSGIYFAQLVEERTNGAVKIEVYCDEALGDETSVIRQVQFGGIDMARVSTAQLIAHSERMAVLSLPYLYRDDEHMWRVIDGEIGDSLLEAIGDSGVVGLSWYDAGQRNFYTTQKKVETLEDLRGLTIRVQESSYMEDMVRALGAKPEAVPYSLVYSSLSTGAVDGAENNFPSYEATQHYRVAPYVLLDGHVRIPEMQIMSQKTAESLPEEYLDIIRDCAQESAVYQRELWEEREQAAMERTVAAGTVVTELSPAELNKFREACQPLYETYAGDYMDLVEQILAAQ